MTFDYDIMIIFKLEPDSFLVCRKVSLLVVGLDNAGKTTVSKLLQKLPINVIAPTVGYSSDQFKFRK